MAEPLSPTILSLFHSISPRDHVTLVEGVAPTPELDLEVDADPAVGSLRTLGSGPNQAVAGNDARLDAPPSDGSAATPSLRTLGTGATQAAAGNDPRFGGVAIAGSFNYAGLAATGAAVGAVANCYGIAVAGDGGAGQFVFRSGTTDYNQATRIAAPGGWWERINDSLCIKAAWFGMKQGNTGLANATALQRAICATINSGLGASYDLIHTRPAVELPAGVLDISQGVYMPVGNTIMGIRNQTTLKWTGTPNTGAVITCDASGCSVIDIYFRGFPKHAISIYGPVLNNECGNLYRTVWGDPGMTWLGGQAGAPGMWLCDRCKFREIYDFAIIMDHSYQEPPGAQGTGTDRSSMCQFIVDNFDFTASGFFSGCPDSLLVKNGHLSHTQDPNNPLPCFRMTGPITIRDTMGAQIAIDSRHMQVTSATRVGTTVTLTAAYENGYIGAVVGEECSILSSVSADFPNGRKTVTAVGALNGPGAGLQTLSYTEAGAAVTVANPCRLQTVNGGRFGPGFIQTACEAGVSIMNTRLGEATGCFVEVNQDAIVASGKHPTYFANVPNQRPNINIRNMRTGHIGDIVRCVTAIPTQISVEYDAGFGGIGRHSGGIWIWDGDVGAGPTNFLLNSVLSFQSDHAEFNFFTEANALLGSAVGFRTGRNPTCDVLMPHGIGWKDVSDRFAEFTRRAYARDSDPVGPAENLFFAGCVAWTGGGNELDYLNYGSSIRVADNTELGYAAWTIERAGNLSFQVQTNTNWPPASWSTLPAGEYCLSAYIRCEGVELDVVLGVNPAGGGQRKMTKIANAATWQRVFMPFYYDGTNPMRFFIANSNMGTGWHGTGGRVGLPTCWMINRGRNPAKWLPPTGAVNTTESRLISTLYKTAAPVTGGPYIVGDIVYNTAPNTGGYIGWVCTVAGSPGTWKAFGLIA